MNENIKTTPSFLATFSRSQISSALATVVDFGLLFSLTELCHVWYVTATASGALAGALTNFFINRHWSFLAQDGQIHRQAGRYVMVSGLSLVLNTGGVYLLTEFGHVHYAISVGVVTFIVGLAVNFPLQRYFVFR